MNEYSNKQKTPTLGQVEAINTLDNNVAVSASAGTGKTHVLVERFINILKKAPDAGSYKISVKNILAITYTRKAAMEMKDRIRKRLMEEYEYDNNKFWREQLEKLESAQITTIHGFCSHVLRENAVEAGLDPAFDVADEIETNEFKDDVLKDFIKWMLKKHNEAIDILVEAYGVKSLFQQIKYLLPKLETIVTHRNFSKYYNDGLKKSIGAKKELCTLLHELVKRRGEASDKAKVLIGQLKDIADNLQDIAKGIEAEPADFRAYNKYVKPLSSSSKNFGELIAEIKNTYDTVYTREADNKAIEIVKAWEQILQEFSVYFEERKRTVGFMSFDDLENLALKLLKEHAEVRKKYMQRYRYVMVDEFQDTNERQKQLIYLLCSGDAENLSEDYDKKKLFVVGDFKQSIYRFRGAEVDVFKKVQNNIKATNGKVITLSDNFRTMDTILNVCNMVFPKLMKGYEEDNDNFNLYHNAQRRCKKGKDKEENIEKGNKELLFLKVMFGEMGEGCKEKLKDIIVATKDKRKLEAKAVAKKVLELRGNGISYGEMTILLRARTHCNLITDALREEGVPYQVTDGTGFYERQEVLDLLNLLMALQNRYRSLELAGVLRSNYFGLDDTTITKLFLEEKRYKKPLWDVLQENDIILPEKEQQELVERAANILKKLRQSAMLLPLPLLWTKIFAELHIVAVLSLQEDGVIKLANAKKLMQLANRYSAEKHGTLGSWLEYTNKLRKTDAAGKSNTQETSANLSVDDAVTIMTIHKAKGLEFNTVFLPMLDADRQRDKGVIKFDNEKGLGIKVPIEDGSLAETSVFKDIKKEENELENEEYQRLLYVAMTRARDRLILSGVPEECGMDTNGIQDNKDEQSNGEAYKNWFDSIDKIFDKNKNALEDMVKVVKEKDLCDNSHDGDSIDEKQSNYLPDLELIDVLAQYNLKKDFTASRLQTYLHCPREYFYRYVAGLPEFEETAASKGTTLPAYIIGLIVHKTLEYYDGRDLNEAWKRAVNEYAEGRSPDKYFGLLKKYVSSDLFKKLTGEKLKEIRFTYKADNDFIIKGVIDCQITEDNGLRIIDYKTGRAPAEDENIDGYYMQLAIYKKTVEKIYGKKVISAELHFLQDLSVKELPEAGEWAEKALNLCSELSRKGEEKDFECNFGSCGHCMYSYLCPKK